MVADIATVTQSVTTFFDFIGSFENINSTMFFLFSLGLCGFGAKKAADFNKDNSDFFAVVEDQLDKEVFHKLAIPLYNAMTDVVFNETSRSMLSEKLNNPAKYLEKYENSKKIDLEKIDFTLLEPSLGFQNALNEIIISQRNHIDFKKRKSSCKIYYICQAVFGGTSLILLLCYYTSIHFYLMYSTCLSILYILTLVITLIFTVIAWVNKVMLDNFK
jgi:hypothetical protein